jgi:hypothetical protein
MNLKQCMGRLRRLFLTWDKKGTSSMRDRSDPFDLIPFMAYLESCLKCS